MTAILPITAIAPQPIARPRRNWPAALAALRRLLADKDATHEVFAIMQALNGDATWRAYSRLLTTVEGGQLAFRREEIAALLANRDWLRSLPEDSLGRAYLAHVEANNISAEGLIEVSSQVMKGVEHPVAWFGRRIRDVHDLWHVLAGYGTDGLGEACLVAFSFPQTGGLGWAFIAAGAILRSRKAEEPHPYARAIWEGYRRGRNCAWLGQIDYAALLPQPLEAVRAQLGLEAPHIYNSIPPHARMGAVPKAA
ncbi:Coq4 family protein [Sandarakinorhabdus rubra]|uniref:Coq4 family protein n=1 Tax=Sandarakinorhabdus rubra TaxID=2672568 RepID=UPI0013DAD1CA|nr:Coq4 family protein [Sandarakinorhabdus rubra]